MFNKEAWHNLLGAVTVSVVFALVGAFIGVGMLLNSGERLSARLVIGRAISTAGLSMAAGAALFWVPDLSTVGQIGIAAGLACIGTAGLERLLSKIVGNASKALKEVSDDKG